MQNITEILEDLKEDESKEEEPKKRIETAQPRQSRMGIHKLPTDWMHWKTEIEKLNTKTLWEHQKKSGAKIWGIHQNWQFEDEWKRDVVRALHTAVLESADREETLKEDPFYAATVYGVEIENANDSEKRWFLEFKKSFRSTPVWYVDQLIV